MDSFDPQEEQVPNDFRGCHVGACFACGLGGGNRKTIEWQRSQPNPLPMFKNPTDFYTPMLLPGMYLPFDMSAFRVDRGIPFYTFDNAELAQKISAYLSHEAVHRHLSFGVVPLLIRLIATRCYTVLAFLTRDGFHPPLWEILQSLNKNIENLFMAIAPLHEVVANLRNMVTSKDDHTTMNISRQSLAIYNEAYGENFAKVYSDFDSIIKRLEDWFAPEPIRGNVMIALAEFLLLSAIDVTEMRNDVLAPPPLLPEKLLPSFLEQYGIPFLEAHIQRPSPPHLRAGTYDIYNIAERTQKIASEILKAKPKLSKKAPKTEVEQGLYIAKACPSFQGWLQCIEIFSWLKRRIFDGISEMQAIIRVKGVGSPYFDLPLVEVWRSDWSPNIIISILNKSTNDVKLVNYAKRGDHERVVGIMGDRILSNNLIAFYLPSDKSLGIWYAPACDEDSYAPITPEVNIMGERDGEVAELGFPMHNLTVFESLRVQVALGEGIRCPFHHQCSGNCCGRAGLMWSIYEAGEKAKEELGWHPLKWEKPECSKTDNS